MIRSGHFIPLIACKKGFSNNVSGHVQMPLHAVQLLANANHEVHLFTNPPSEDRPDLPDILPTNIKIHYVEDGRKRTKVVDGVGGKGRGFDIRSILTQMKQIKSLVQSHEIELFHSYGYARTATFTALLGYYGLKIPKVATLYGLPKLNLKESIIRKFWKSLHLISSTKYVASLCEASNLNAEIVRSGPVRDLVKEMGSTPIKKQKRVLFWRDPTKDNGADVCLDVFDKLAPQFPDVSFEMAIRPHWDEIEGIGALQTAHKNVKVHMFPYKDGVSLADLITGSTCILLPFRKHSIHPQLAIAESLAAGIPVVTTDLCSAPELVQDEITGTIVPVNDVNATASAVESMLESPESTTKMGDRATSEMETIWGWKNYVEEINSIYQKFLTQE